jgi:oligoribonuclease
MKGFVKKQAHTALADIEESIEELRYYRNTFFIPVVAATPPPTPSD